MARPRSEDKRNAILTAATQVFADRGLGAATQAISSAAGVAEGTLFTYFKTKDDLVNALYREIKLELADVMMSGFPRKKSVRTRMQHIWNAYVTWGVANPPQRKVLALLEVSDKLTRESRQAGAAPFVEVPAIAEDAFAQHIFQDDLSFEFIGGIIRALADTTMDFMTFHPKTANKYRESGFEVLWAGITKKR